MSKKIYMEYVTCILESALRDAGDAFDHIRVTEFLIYYKDKSIGWYSKADNIWHLPDGSEYGLFTKWLTKPTGERIYMTFPEMLLELIGGVDNGQK